MFPTDTQIAPTGETPDEVVLERMALLVVGEHRFGVAIERIREIIPARPYTPLPGSGPHVCGLINLRGRIVTVIDLGARLSLPPASADPDHSIVIVEHQGRLAGLAVQEVSRIVDVDPDALQDAAATLRALRIDRAWLRGVGETDGQVFVAVDPDEIIAPILSA
ncbi:MAG TPA: chemotaxis protein CheW [Longimicrobium sp.]|nr:chemotaxis protein CheW [Longimicrobium sp.]